MVAIQMASLRRSVCCRQPGKGNSAYIHDIRDGNFEIRVFTFKKKKKKKKSVGFRGIHSNGDYLDSSMGKMAGRSKFYKTKAIFTVRNNMSSY